MLPATGAEAFSAIPGLVNPPKLNKKTRRQLIRWGIVAGNIALLVSVGIFVGVNRSTSQTVRSSTVSSPTATASSSSNPLDQLSSAQIAFTAAQMTKLPELTAIRNQADSEVALLSVIPSDTSILAKPQLAATAQKSKHDIIKYVTKKGDTVAGLASRFKVTTNSIRWSNNLTGDSLSAGVTLYIPPINGIVYVVKTGDTPASLAQKYSSNKTQITVYNDAEVSGLKPGERIIIPDASPPTALNYSSYSSYDSFLATYGGNGYDYGYCTWYVANKVPVPTNWGNANTWAYYAALSGWTVNVKPPHAGVIAQSASGWAGHVAYVEAVSPDGTMIKYSDMNGLAGWGRVGYSDWVPVSKYPHYIYQ